MDSNINQRIKQYLKCNGYSVKTLSSMLGVNAGTLANKLNGVRGMDLETICSLLELFPDMSSDWLLLGSGPMTRATEPHVYQVNDSGDNIQGTTINKNDCGQFIKMLQEKDRQIAKLIDIIERK